jgi:hypothetical protein
MSRRAGFLGRLPPRSARGAVRVLAASPPGDTPFAAGLDCGHPGNALTAAAERECPGRPAAPRPSRRGQTARVVTAAPGNRRSRAGRSWRTVSCGSGQMCRPCKSNSVCLGSSPRAWNTLAAFGFRPGFWPQGQSCQSTPLQLGAGPPELRSLSPSGAERSVLSPLVTLSRFPRRSARPAPIPIDPVATRILRQARTLDARSTRQTASVLMAAPVSVARGRSPQ